MTTAYLMIVMSLFIPLACSWYAKWSVKGYDGKAPRDFLAGLGGYQKRANYAQQNFYETFPAFAVGVVVAKLMGAQQWTLDLTAVIYVTARVLYAVFYIMDNHLMRSTTWIISFGAIIALYFIGV